jgi:hypothetical protein
VAIAISSESFRSTADIGDEGPPAELRFKPCIGKMLCEFNLTETLTETTPPNRASEFVEVVNSASQASSRIPDHLEGLANLSEKYTALKGGSPSSDRLVQPTKRDCIGFRLV